MPITSSTQHSSIYGWNGSSWERVEVNSGNQLEVEIKNTTPIDVSGSFAVDISGQNVVVSNNTDPATSTKQDAQTSLLSSLDTNITACNTGAVVVSSSALPTGAATSANQGSTIGLLSSIDANITTCNTGAVVVSSSALPSGAATDTLQTAGNASLSTIAGDTTSLDGKITQGNASQIVAGSLQQVLIYGKDSAGDLHTANISNSGDLDVEIADFVKGQALASASFPVVLASDSVVQTAAADVNNKGSYGNVANNVTINSGAQSSAADIADMNSVSLLYEDTATASFDGLDVLVSGDGVNYNTITQLYPTTNTAGTIRYAYYQASLGGLTHLKIENTSSFDNYTNVKCSVWGCPA